MRLRIPTVTAAATLALAGALASTTMASGSAPSNDTPAPEAASSATWSAANAFDAEYFRVTTGSPGDLVVKVRDTGLAGDRWQATIIGSNGATKAGKCGNGSLTTFSGQAKLSLPAGTHKVVIVYCKGIDLFSASGEFIAQTPGSLSITKIDGDA
jgi:hypothetical protein